MIYFSLFILYVAISGSVYSHTMHPVRTPFMVLTCFVFGWVCGPGHLLLWVLSSPKKKRPEARHIRPESNRIESLDDDDFISVDFPEGYELGGCKKAGFFARLSDV